MKRRKTAEKERKELPDILSSFLLLAYGFVTWLTPNMNTFDSNGPKFLTFSILNILVFTFFVFAAKNKGNVGTRHFLHFFKTNVGIAYGVMLVMAIISFTKAINVNEGIIHFSKVFTTFSAAMFVFAIVSRDRKSLLPLAIGLSVLLIIDSIQTFKGISNFIENKLSTVNFIKSSYSNKNILTSAIFVKLPFAIWLFYFQKNWSRYIGLLAMFFGTVAVFFLSARAFYLGLILITILLTIYALYSYRKTKEKSYVKSFAVYMGSLLIAFGVFSFVQRNMYPRVDKGTQVGGVGARLSTVTSRKNYSNKLRLTAWGQSWQMIKKDPLLGVGIGNWKIRVLEYENSYSDTYTYMYKNHNDFIETTVEYGVLGGLAFIAVFVFILWYFAKVLFFKRDERLQYLFFLPAFGMIAYFFDAFFNFPQDRPEIQSLFAIYVGIAGGLCFLEWGGDGVFRKLKFNNKSVLTIFLSVIIGITLLFSTYVLYMNFKSLKLQRIIKQETRSGKLKSSSERFLKGFPAIPDITILEEPISVQKARYLINEKKYQQAREIMRNDNSNPYDARKEYFMAMTFYNENNYDSAMYYGLKALELKPYFYNSNTIVASIYEKRGEFDKSIALWKKYVGKVKNRPQPWIIPASLLERQGKLAEAEELIDSAHKYLPNNEQILSIISRIKQKKVASVHMDIYEKASAYYRAMEYAKALPVFSEFIKKTPNYAKAYELRAVCYYNLKEYKKCLNDVLKEESLGVKLSSNVVNIKAAAYLMTGNREKAKEFFMQAIKMGDKDARNNYIQNFGKIPDENISFQIPTKK